jgi:hypothetical protein
MSNLTRATFAIGTLLCLTICGCDGEKETDQDETDQPNVAATARTATPAVKTENADVADQVTSKYTLKPGVGMGSLNLGDDEAKVVEVLGEPRSMIGEDRYEYPGLMVWVKEGKTFAFHCGDKDKPDSQDVKDCPCQTAEGIAMGSSLHDIIEAYGEPDHKQDLRRTPGAFRVFYRSNGMVFNLHNDRVYFIVCRELPQ